MLCDVTMEAEQVVTFQIAMTGSDGLVIASDRLGRYGAGATIPQMFSQKKYFISPGRSLVCFAAGGPTASNLAREISVQCDDLGSNEAESHSALYRVAASTPGSDRPSSDDEVIVAQTNALDAVWLVLRRPGTVPFPTVLRQSSVCTGNKTSALFLPRHLWRPERSVTELKKLALLTLSYASKEEPSFVAPPFDLVTMERTNATIREESHSSLTNAEFQNGLESLLYAASSSSRTLQT